MGVSESAELKEIKRAFKKMARQFHPDLVANSDDPEMREEAEFKMKTLNKAKEVLLDPIKREKYDSKLSKSKTLYHEGSELIFRLDDDDEGSNEKLDIEWNLEKSSEDWDIEEDWEDTYIDEISDIIHSPPAQTDSKPQVKPIFPGTLGFEVAPGVLFLQQCIKCGRINYYGNPYCEGCQSSLIFDNHPFFYSEQNPQDSFTPPTKPGFKPKDKPGMIIVKKCMKCANVNVNDNMICSGCGTSLVYYQRPIQIDKIGTQDYQDGYNSGSNWGILECPKCGTENELDREFCYSCFTNLRTNPKPISITHSENARPLEPDPEATSSIIKKCPNCGDLNYSYRDFCQKCNTRLVYNPPPISITQSDDDVDHETREELSGNIICPHCGADNLVENEYCSSCYKNLIVTKYKKY